MSDAYKKAIEIIAAQDIDWRSICMEVAKESPSVFVDAYRRASGLEKTENEIRDIAKEDLIQGVKKAREVHHMSLKDAKAFVEQLLEEGE